MRTNSARSRQVSAGAFDVSLQHDELLAQECVFEHHLRLAAGKVQDGIQGKGLVVRLCPTAETLLDRVAQRVQASSDEGREAESMVHLLGQRVVGTIIP